MLHYWRENNTMLKRMIDLIIISKEKRDLSHTIQKKDYYEKHSIFKYKKHAMGYLIKKYHFPCPLVYVKIMNAISIL